MAEDDNKKKPEDEFDPDEIAHSKFASTITTLSDSLSGYRKQLAELNTKVFTGRYKGVTIQLKGDFTMVDVKIDQSVYETASRETIQNSFLVCYTNLRNAIRSELDSLTNGAQEAFNKANFPLF